MKSSPFGKFLPTLLVTIICLLVPVIIACIPIIGWLFWIVAGPAIGLIFYSAIAFIVDKGMEQPIEALKKGYACFMVNPGINWVCSFIISVLGGIGAIAYGVGVLLTMPVAVVGMTIAYQELSAKLDNPAGPSVQA